MAHTEDENFDLEFDQDGDNDGDNDGDENGNDPLTGKECTGRWTREEHQLFVKGLELYGKGWKKIASLIKTRTVVQIRTHAQKYFLKLSKARQNGELAGGLGQYGFRKRRLKRRYTDRPVAIAPILQPYLKPSTSSENLEPSDIDDGIYNFLSASLDNSSPDDSLGNTENRDSPSTDEALKDVMDASERCSALTLPSSPNSTSKKRKNFRKIVPPLWYRKGQSIDILLKEAEELDWSQDAQALLAKQRINPATWSNSNAPFLGGNIEPTAKPAEKRKATEDKELERPKTLAGMSQTEFSTSSARQVEAKIRRLSNESLLSLINAEQEKAVDRSSGSRNCDRQVKGEESEDATGFFIDEGDQTFGLKEETNKFQMSRPGASGAANTEDNLDVFFDGNYFEQIGAASSKKDL